MTNKFKFNDVKISEDMFGVLLDHIRLQSFAELTAKFSDPTTEFVGLNIKKKKTNQHSIKKIDTIQNLNGFLIEIANLRKKLQQEPLANILDNYAEVE